MNFEIINKTGHPLTIKVMQGQRTINTYHAPNPVPVPVKEKLVWSQTHFHLEQNTEIHGSIFWELVGLEPLRLRYTTSSRNGNQDVAVSREHRRNQLVIASITGGGHILVGEIGIIGEGDDT